MVMNAGFDMLFFSAFWLFGCIIAVYQAEQRDSEA